MRNFLFIFLFIYINIGIGSMRFVCIDDKFVVENAY